MAEEVATDLDQRSREEVLDELSTDRPQAIKAFVATRSALRTRTYLHGIETDPIRTYIKMLESTDPTQLEEFVERLAQNPDGSSTIWSLHSRQ